MEKYSAANKYFYSSQALNPGEEKLLNKFVFTDSTAGFQFWNRFSGQKLSPEEELMRAVLEDAIHCYQKYISSTNRGQKSLWVETQEWIFSYGYSMEPFSFETVCEVLKLNPDYLRKGLIAWKEERVK